jgi:hypothetical protein
MPALTSYGNPGGTGDRTAQITVTQDPAGLATPFPEWVDGDAAIGGSIQYLATAVGSRVLFDFSALGARIIDEFSLYKFASPAGWGTVQFRGSLDGIDWDDLGAPLAVGTGEKYVHPIGNAAAYPFYDLLHTVAAGGPVTIQEIDFKIASACEPHAPTSYTYPGGVGDRSALIEVAGTAALNSGVLDTMHDASLINGVMTADNRWFTAGQSAVTIEFDFSTIGPQAITGFTWWQSNTTTHGTWVFEGYNGATWDQLAGPFTLGNPRPQIVTVADSGYRERYRLRQTSGVTSDSPFLDEIEFELGPPEAEGATDAFSYGNAGGQGDRSALMGVSANFVPAIGSVGNLVDGDFSADGSGSFGYEDLAAPSALITFELLTAQAIAEFRFFRSSPADNWGTWQFRASADDVTYLNLGDPLVLGGTERRYHNACNQLAYPFYQLQHVAGTLAGAPWLTEIEFRIGGEPVVLAFFPHRFANQTIFGTPVLGLLADVPPLLPQTVANASAIGAPSLSAIWPAPIQTSVIQGH